MVEAHLSREFDVGWLGTRGMRNEDEAMTRGLLEPNQTGRLIAITEQSEI